MMPLFGGCRYSEVPLWEVYLYWYLAPHKQDSVTEDSKGKLTSLTLGTEFKLIKISKIEEFAS